MDKAIRDIHIILRLNFIGLILPLDLSLPNKKYIYN